MTDFLRLLLDAIAYIWPFRIVYQYQRGCYFVLGKFWREVGPGVYPVVPWFTEVQEADIAEAIIGTGRLDITLSDGSMLSFAARATVQVVDARAALVDVDQYRETAQEALEAVLADRLADLDAARLENGSRRRLLNTLRAAVAEELKPYGVEVKKIRFTSFVLNAKAYRFIVDQTAQVGW
jgi:regulator of protease activity HflC (stomatin/prohibitin superfamily)